MVIFNAGQQLFMASSTFWSHGKYALPGSLIDGWCHVTISGQDIVTRSDVCCFQARGALKPGSKNPQSSLSLLGRDGQHLRR